jgi:cation:H+ antiporter
LIIWRLEAMAARGVEGTLLGTLFMPYFSGLGNLIFVSIVLSSGGPPAEVMVNCVVNNATNLTLILGLCGVLFPMALGKPGVQRRRPARSKGGTLPPFPQLPPLPKLNQKARLHRLSLLFTMLALLFFTGISWALARDGVLDMGDGVTLIGLFLFWQTIHVFDVLKDRIRGQSRWHPMIMVDLGIISVASVVLYLSVEWFVAWVLTSPAQWVQPEQLGLLTGWLMVLPNAIVAFYYAWRKRMDVVYASQLGDAHICIPLCLGLYAIFRDMPLEEGTGAGLLFIMVACVVHAASVGIYGQLHRATAAVLTFGYVVFLAWA